LYFFSIITPTYQRLENIKNLYKNLLKQRNKLFLFEWLVIVEKKDFNTINFLRRITDIKVRIIINKRKFSFIIKQGIKKSSGKYLVIIGDDDGFYGKKLKKIYDILLKKKYPSWAISQCDYQNNKGQVIRKFTTVIKEILLDFDNLIFLKFVNYYMAPGIFVKKNFYNKINYFPSSYGNVNDYKTWLDLRKIEKPVVIRKKISFAGYSDSSISGRLNLNKYYYLHKIINKENFFIKIISLFFLTMIFIINLFFKFPFIALNYLKKITF
jgi:hypothetical protein